MRSLARLVALLVFPASLLAAPLRELTPDVAKKRLHAFKMKAATWERRRGYGENEFFSSVRVPTTRTQEED